MRLAIGCCLLVFLAEICLAGIGVAQDTNFPVGPQYLMNYGSPLLLQPIATPTLSFAPAPASVPVAATEVGAGTQAAPTPAGVQSQTDLPRIYWGGPSTSENAGAASEIGVTSQQPSVLPASIVNVGVTEMLDAHTLRDRGYGMTPGEAAAFWKTHKNHASHIYTNADIARLHRG